MSETVIPMDSTATTRLVLPAKRGVAAAQHMSVTVNQRPTNTVRTFIRLSHLCGADADQGWTDLPLRFFFRDHNGWANSPELDKIL